MVLNKNFFTEILLTPKKAFVARKLHVVLLVSLLVGGLVYLKQRSVQKQSIQQKIAELKNLGSDYAQVINELQAHIDSLTSRIKYLSIDNKRLSSTGQKLSQQLTASNSKVSKKISETKSLQLELASLDQKIIHNYEVLIGQQESYISLKVECNKTKNKEHDKKCLSYALTKDKVDTVTSELKSLKHRREVLVSEIARFNSNL